MSAPVLCIYSPHLETELHCDASSHGVAGILLQRQLIDDSFHPVMYYSKRTTDVEAKWHSFELETMAIVSSIKRFHVYLQGIPFKVLTDCNALTQTLVKKDINPKIARWALFLECYDYSIAHKAGNQMKHVDCLSRNVNILMLEENTFERNLAIAQERDPEEKNIKEKNIKESNVIKCYHDDVGHVGIDKTCELITRSYWFPRMKMTVRDHIASCLKCIAFSPLDRVSSYLHNIDKGTKPFETVHVDHYGPLETTKKRNKYILLVIDAFTKYVKVYATKTTCASEVIAHLKNYFIYFDKPQRLISDRGSGFTSVAFSNFLEENDVKHVKVATACPRANGQVERMNRFMTPIIAKMVDKPRDIEWDCVLNKVEYVFNNTVCRSIDSTPSRMLFGIDQRGFDNDVLKDNLNLDRLNVVCVEQVRNQAILKNKQVQEYNKRQYDKKCKRNITYECGDYVMIRNVVGPGVNKKLMPSMKGPYVVKKCLGNDRYVLSDIDGYQLTQIPFEGIFDSNKMRMWMRAQSEVDCDLDFDVLDEEDESESDDEDIV